MKTHYTQKNLNSNTIVPNISAITEEKNQSSTQTQTDNFPKKNDSSKGIQIRNGIVPRSCPRKIIVEAAIITPQFLNDNSTCTQTESSIFPESNISTTR